MASAQAKKRNRLIAVSAGILLLAVFVAFRVFRSTEADYYVLKPIDLNYTILANCTADYPKPLDMAFLSGGVVLKIEARDGESVSKGQPLVRLDDFEARRNLAISADSLKAAELKLRNARDEVLPALQEKLKEAQVNLDQARLTLKRYREIEAAGGIPKAELEKAEKEYQRASSLFTQQDLELRNFAESGRLADLESQVSIARSRLELAEKALRDTLLEAPFDGAVLKVHVQAGEKARPEAPAVTVIENADWELVLNVDQKELPFLKLGLSALVVMDAYPGTKIDGKVTYVCSEVDKEKNTCEIRVRIPASIPFIKSGMAGKAEIMAETFEKTPALPSRFAKKDSGESFVWAWNGRRAERVKAAFRPVGERWVIPEGLSEGLIVLDAGAGAPAARLRPGREVQASAIR